VSGVVQRLGSSVGSSRMGVAAPDGWSLGALVLIAISGPMSP
jgi:hypothetical protein